MTERLLACVAGVACAVVGLGAGDAPASVFTRAPASVVTRTPAAVSARAPARMLVYAQEWSLWPSRGSLPAGRVTVQLWNRGQDAHDLRIRRLRRGAMVGRAERVSVTPSGRLHQATWKLGPGSYELYCSLPGHLHRGMHVRIVVS